jgi:hypothetical protein
MELYLLCDFRSVYRFAVLLTLSVGMLRNANVLDGAKCCREGAGEVGFRLCVAVPVTADLINLMTVRSNGFRSHYTG